MAATIGGMIDKDKVILETRLVALELIVARFAAIQTRELSDDQFDEILRDWVSAADALTLSGVPAVESDMWSAALGDSLQALLKLIRETRSQLKSR